MKLRYNLPLGLILAVLLGLAGCGDREEAEVSLDPVAFHSEDECHVCGMVVMAVSGPKGQAVARDGVRKFCSTADMLSWRLQPENRILQLRLSVHDMGRSNWHQPDDA